MSEGTSTGANPMSKLKQDAIQLPTEDVDIYRGPDPYDLVRNHLVVSKSAARIQSFAVAKRSVASTSGDVEECAKRTLRRTRAVRAERSVAEHTPSSSDSCAFAPFAPWSSASFAAAFGAALSRAKSG